MKAQLPPLPSVAGVGPQSSRRGAVQASLAGAVSWMRSCVAQQPRLRMQVLARPHLTTFCCTRTSLTCFYPLGYSCMHACTCTRTRMRMQACRYICTRVHITCEIERSRNLGQELKYHSCMACIVEGFVCNKQPRRPLACGLRGGPACKCRQAGNLPHLFRMGQLHGAYSSGSNASFIQSYMHDRKFDSTEFEYWELHPNVLLQVLVTGSLYLVGDLLHYLGHDPVRN